MTEKDLQEIQEIIGYSFKNPMLLQQAFIRRSYTQENSDHQNNEVLEFIGDKVLDLAVIRHLASMYGQTGTNGEYVSKYNEGKLTEIKKRLVSQTMLAHRIDILGLNKYLIMGKGDFENNVQDDISVKEDLFEAIIGAIALDCSWLWHQIDFALKMMLPIAEYLANGFDTDEENYVELIQEWCQKHNKTTPCYSYCENPGASLHPIFPNAVRQYEHVCILKIPDINPDELGLFPVFSGIGSSKARARMMAAKSAYDYLIVNNLLFSTTDIVGEPEFDKAINQLQELSHKGYFSNPTYSFAEEHDENGNPMWYCECRVAEYETYFWAKNSSKKDSKKNAALGMLKFVLDMDEKKN